MTREEREQAIAILENEKKCVNRANKNDYCNRDCYNCELVKTDTEILTALDMAIKALQEQADNIPVMYYPQVDGITPTVVAQADGEYILKSEAIRVASGYCHPSNIAKELEKLPTVVIPSAEPKTEWIPVSERLPEDSEVILFSTKTDRVFEGRYFADNTDRQWYSFRDETFAWNNVVTAWMPLPTSYEPQEGSKE